jgi:uroporphyrinogen decarboxylase
MDQPDLVRAEMERLIPLLKEGGGYIFASDHSIPNSVSLENMKTISDLAHRLGRY